MGHGEAIAVDPIVCVSPHLDDCCFSAGQFLAGRPDAVVYTPLSADPPHHVTLTDYDRSCGFSSSADAMRARRGEDVVAMKMLHATAVHGGHLDGQYGVPLDPEAVADDIAKLLHGTGATMLVGPLGLAHPDHEAVADAVLTVAVESGVDTWLYEELPARVLWPETVAPALGRVRGRGFTDVSLDFIGTGDVAVKLKAIRCYRSQLGALARAAGSAALHPVLCPERFWRVR